MNEHANKPKTLSRSQNSVVISWENVFLDGSYYILQLCNSFNEWRTIYNGKKTQIRVADLAPCNFYNFRIKSDENWIEFKSGTLESPYVTMHMTRAVNFAKTSLIRKIAHDRPHLLNTENKNSKSPLVQAIEKNDLNLVTFLVNLGSNPNTPSLGVCRTPLMIAIYLGYLNIASFLSDKGAKRDDIDVNGLNILHYAVDSNKIDGVEFVLNFGIHLINSQDRHGWTPLLRAVILEQSEDIILRLLEAGGDDLIEDRNGYNFHKHRLLKRV